MLKNLISSLTMRKKKTIMLLGQLVSEKYNIIAKE